MNCKQGDLAIIVHSEGGGEAGQLSKMLLGRIVRVIRLGKPQSDLHCYADLVWFFEEPIHLVLNGKRFSANGIADFCLRPIDNPGDDVVDEVIQRLGAPTRDEVTA